MNLKELNSEQLRELKEHYYTSNHDNVSYGELANIDELVTYEELEKEYQNTIFSHDDFFSTRYCNHCGEVMQKGYCINQGIEYYCCDSCLHEHYTPEKYNELYREGDSFYSEWY